ncbi:hypothetical protein [Streptomyces sp. 35G-GA-8]|uniref:hypothetical protein n=1 Tax=Streptomyces sp. 35G-GA-8 TaxID=2939434 RepID=UPI00201F3AC3|nr:hypothetical protein [Streptomyces sp. 35G-GA-8]MCL7381294.1 hypothetical protein [Streptomyces sp. 35G-GA-8]
MGPVGGNVTVINGAPLDETVADLIVPPRLREGPYPAADVRARLRAFVEPPTFRQCRKVLDSHILVLRAGSGTGASTAAFALLAERYGTGGITGIDSPDDLSRWRPAERRGYLLQGLSPAAATSLGEVVLTGLAELLRLSGAHLVVTVRSETTLPVDTVPWQVEHLQPPAFEVASKRLKTTPNAGELTTEQSTEALGRLGAADFADYLRAHPLPQDGVDVAEGLRDLVVFGKPAASVLDDLRAGSITAARKALAEAGDRADSLALMAAISLLSEQDRTVLEKFSAVLRPHIEERGGPAPDAAGQPEPVDTRRPATARPRTGRNLLGPSFEERLEAVGAHQLPLRFGSAQRYPVQPVAFSGRHRSEALLRCLWLDYEGMADLMWRALGEVAHHSGIELAAGQAIGKVLAHATGPDTLRQLHPFAVSDRRWRRRLVAYALGEMVQYPALTSAVREQLRQWSRSTPIALRCTVAETCAGSYGLARPAAALKLLDSVLNGPETKLEDSLRAAVSFALSTLLSEDANHPLVLDRLREWQGAAPGTQHHALAVHIVECVSSSTFPRPGAPGERRVRLADLLADHPERAFDLVVTALNDPATHEAMAKGLSLIESEPVQRRRTAFPDFLTALSGTARTNRGVLRFVLRRHRVRTASSAEGFAS